VTTTIDALKQTLSTAPDGNITITVGTVTDVVTVADLALALGVRHVPPPPTVLYQGWVGTNATGGLHVRAVAGTSGAILGTLAIGTPVNVFSDTPKVANGYTWLHIGISGLDGWSAEQFITKTNPNPPPPKPAGNRIGLHVLEDGIVDAQTFIDATNPPCMAYINAIDAANKAVASGVPWVVFRSVPGPDGDRVSIPEDDPALSYNTGRQTVQSRWGQFSNLDKRVKIQITNEPAWNPGHDAFWRGVMDELEARGYCAAIGAYSVGTPEPVQFSKMVPSLTQAKSNGHCVVLHSYCAPNTPAGQMSPTALQQLYEVRFIRLYAAVPVEARPPLIMSEFAGEFSRGKFQGTDNLLKLCGLYETAISAYDYFVGFCLWTCGVGNWADASINSALPALATWIKGNK